MSGISKTENQDKNEKGVKLLQIPFFHIRSSDMHYYFLPSFYLFIVLVICLSGFYYGLDIRNFSISSYLDFLQKYRYEVLLFLIPLLFMFFKLGGLIINSIGGVLISMTKKVDQKIPKEVFENIGKNNEILKYLNDFYKFDEKIKDTDLYGGPVYWHIFHYVMDYYYAQENVYDDLRKTIFIRNIIASNLILIILIFFIGISLGENVKTLIYIVILGIICYLLYNIYIKLLRKYHIKLVLTFIYIFNNIKNINEK